MYRLDQGQKQPAYILLLCSPQRWWEISEDTQATAESTAWTQEIYLSLPSDLGATPSSAAQLRQEGSA